MVDPLPRDPRSRKCFRSIQCQRVINSALSLTMAPPNCMRICRAFSTSRRSEVSSILPRSYRPRVSLRKWQRSPTIELTKAAKLQVYASAYTFREKSILVLVKEDFIERTVFVVTDKSFPGAPYGIKDISASCDILTVSIHGVGAMIAQITLRCLCRSLEFTRSSLDFPISASTRLHCPQIAGTRVGDAVRSAAPNTRLARNSDRSS